MSARHAETAAAAAFPGMELAEVLERAELQTRRDRKYLLRREVFLAFLHRLADQEDWSILQIGGMRRFRYSSTYFDTPDLLTFRQHRQGRRRRFKVRTRSYLDTRTCTFEVKLEGARDATVKQRTAHPFDLRDELTEEARAFLAEVLRAGYGIAPPDELIRTAVTGYWRRTLVQRSGTARITCDTGLVCRSEAAEVIADPNWVVVECKSAGPPTAADAALAELGVRPTRISKYCLAAAVLHPGLRANPWRRSLRDWFGTEDAESPPLPPARGRPAAARTPVPRTRGPHRAPGCGKAGAVPAEAGGRAA
ncbi:polyphosphate polymerase domain-containing protein [Streptomonospora sp. S1-112]|uniref:Polyphosphate polymerase domain-containing protein n=1 Tax=Streptomonospora mangrovi TaxID=2883123 RepID=A0A9X3NGK0_9ACTN|nr:polyphosphate polymerase domain-containing protein [Streptomonospora mangrovi]MDA0563197.1 polyphosphate polymerase domain-containing protein [Streptomonospora mangrovi]